MKGDQKAYDIDGARAQNAYLVLRLDEARTRAITAWLLSGCPLPGRLEVPKAGDEEVE